MGAVTLGEAIEGIREWSLNEGRVQYKPAQVGEIFGSLVFNDSVQLARLPKAVYQALRDTVTKGHPLEMTTADAVAWSARARRAAAGGSDPSRPETGTGPRLGPA